MPIRDRKSVIPTRLLPVPLRPLPPLPALPGSAVGRAKRTLGTGSIPGLIPSGGGAGNFAAARVNRLNADFNISSSSADNDLFSSNKRLRVRGRDLFLNSGFAVKFGSMVEQNVIGPAGILLQVKIKNAYGKETPDTKKASLRVEAAWTKWCKRGRCTADGQFSLQALQRMAVKTWAREGEFLQKGVYGREFNEVGFALQPLDNDQLDDSMMQALVDGGSIRMGVEVNKYRRPQAYWLYAGHPGDLVGGGNRERARIPAKFIFHSFIQERPGQTRGYTPLSAAMLDIKQYGGFSEATAVAARWAAAKFMVIQNQMAEGYAGEDQDADGDDTNSDGSQYSSGAAGEAMELDPGQTANFIDPRFPTNTFKDYTRTTIRNIATALLVSYPSLGNDLEGVNFSSIRAGLLDERDHWRILQRWFIEHFMQPVYDAWLEMARLTVLSDLVLTDDQWEQITWRARGWEWVDPVKDAAAAILRLQNGLSTYARELANLGLDFEEVMDERAAEQKFIEALKLVLGTDIRGVADAASDPAPGANADAADDGKPDPKAAKPAAKPRSAAGEIVERFLEAHGLE